MPDRTDPAHWDQRYQTGNLPWENGEPSAILRQVIADERIAPCRAVDLGCGSGINSVWLAQQGFEVTGVEFSPVAIELARQRAATAGVRIQFLARDLLSLDDVRPDFRFFLDRGCYHIVRGSDVRRYVQLIADWTVSDALGLVLAGNAKEPRSPGPPVVTEEELRSEWGTHFDVIWLREGRFDPGPRDLEQQPPLAWAALLKRKSNR